MHIRHAMRMAWIYCCAYSTGAIYRLTSRAAQLACKSFAKKRIKARTCRESELVTGTGRFPSSQLEQNTLWPRSTYTGT